MSKAQRIFAVFQELWTFSISLGDFLDHSTHRGSKRVRTKRHLQGGNLAHIDFIEMLDFWRVREDTSENTNTKGYTMGLREMSQCSLRLGDTPLGNCEG